jgi:adenosine deaminase
MFVFSEVSENVLPKVELHLHLDCSLSYQVAARFRSGLTPAQYRAEFAAPAQCSNLVDYIRCAQAGLAIMQTKEQLRAVTLDLFEQLRADNVLYAEVRFAPLLHNVRGLSPEQVVEVVDDATDEGIKEFGVDARLILCTLRHFSEQQSLETVKLVERFRGSRVAGFDIAGDEAGYPLDAHRAAFQYAIERRIHCTCHAGEARGPDSVWETLRDLQPTRIGHGIRSAQDSKLVEHLKQHRIHLEMCPTSNIQTGAARSMREHPVDQLYRAGVSLSINTDGRTISETNLEREYHVVRDTFLWGSAEFLTCNLEAIRSAFAPDAVKLRIEQKLLTAYGGATSGAW